VKSFVLVLKERNVLENVERMILNYMLRKQS